MFLTPLQEWFFIMIIWRELLILTVGFQEATAWKNYPDRFARLWKLRNTPIYA